MGGKITYVEYDEGAFWVYFMPASNPLSEEELLALKEQAQQKVKDHPEWPKTVDPHDVNAQVCVGAYMFVL